MEEMSQDDLLAVWPVGNEHTAHELLDKINESGRVRRKWRIEDVHRFIGKIRNHLGTDPQIIKSGEIKHRGYTRAVYRREW